MAYYSYIYRDLKGESSLDKDYHRIVGGLDSWR